MVDESRQNSVATSETLGRFIVEVLEHLGSSKEAAEVVADSLVFADLRGVSSHGVMRWPLLLMFSVELSPERALPWRSVRFTRSSHVPRVWGISFVGSILASSWSPKHLSRESGSSFGM